MSICYRHCSVGKLDAYIVYVAAFTNGKRCAREASTEKH